MPRGTRKLKVGFNGCSGKVRLSGRGLKDLGFFCVIPWWQLTRPLSSVLILMLGFEWETFDEWQSFEAILPTEVILIKVHLSVLVFPLNGFSAI